MAVRRTRALAELDRLEGGEHVGWVVREHSQFRDLVTRCLRQGAEVGDKLFVCAPPRSIDALQLPDQPQVTVLDPYREFFHSGGMDAQAMYSAVRRHAALAAEQGYRGLRVIADMSWVLDTDLTASELARLEQGLDEVAADTAATVVCAYRWDSFRDTDLAEVMCVHPHEVGSIPHDLGFRIWTSGADRWHLAGQVDLRGADAFPAALDAAVRGRDQLRLDCKDVDFIDVAGMRAIALLASRTEARITVEAASELLRRCWKLAGWDSELRNVEFSA